ncbi:transmembrane protein [Lentinula edodes]|uniref:Transmembrane protein n=1 Tax=Lentinula edodes TaxID=5353 RepID=A0A1Q3DVT4_LENED|nr:transmembrane protein [Lentinula edodes]
MDDPAKYHEIEILANCVSLIGVSILIYAFLSEKVYIVWTGGNQNSRLKARVYRVCAVVLLGYVVVGTLTVIGRDSTIRGDGVCIIGLKSYATISLIVYDMSLNIFLTAMFLWPLWLSHPMSPKLRSIAKRTLYGASTSLVSSMINIAILFLLGGNELGWICLSSCVADVTVNSLALFWLSSGSSWSGDVVRDRFSLPTMDMSALTFVHIESATRPTLSGQPSTIIVSESTQDSHQPHVSMIPEAYFDYIPSEHRTLRNDTEEKTQEHWVCTSNSVSLERSYSKSYSDISGSSTVPENHHAQPSKASSETAGQTATMEEEKDICDL